MSAESFGDCWIWTGGKNAAGYGYVRDNGRKTRVHRIVYEAYIGPIPDGMCVLHRCDNPACVNPAHLFLGTPMDNAHDRDRKGRQTHGEAQHSAKLTRTLAQEIRLRYANGDVTMTQLASQFQVGVSAVWDLLHNVTWK